MAFTETELNSIVKITGVSRITLDSVLDNYAVYLTAEVYTDVRAELTRWDTYGAKFVRLNPTESNFGVETNSNDAKSDIRKNIATLLFLTDVYGYGSQSMLVRG